MSKLSKNFTVSRKPGPLYKILMDKDGFPFSWDSNYKDYEPKKILYVNGPSHMAWSHWRHVLQHNLPEYFIINSAELGKGNEQIISDTEKDLIFLRSLGVTDIKIIITMSMPGMNKDEFSMYPHKEYKTATDWFKSILFLQLQKLQKLCDSYSAFITTGLTPNPLEAKKSILDFCNPTEQEPQTHAYNLHAGTYEWMSSKSKKNFFDFDYASDVKWLDQSLTWVRSHIHMDDSFHINSYKPHEEFLDYAMENMK
tara:strand:+ start:909 stop:1670 length:762 start_codon:yes stop_codon:yes gene_type:complete